MMKSLKDPKCNEMGCEVTTWLDGHTPMKTGKCRGCNTYFSSNDNSVIYDTWKRHLRQFCLEKTLRMLCENYTKINGSVWTPLSLFVSEVL